TAQMGEVCTLINTSCCTYIDESGQITTDIHAIWEHARVLHEVTKDNTAWTTHLWESLTSWLPNFNWLKQLFMGILLLGIIILCAFVFSQCFLWCCKQITPPSYSDWKSHQLRHKIEKGTDFQGM
ncbi:ERVV2 protein, partial [Ifrita kowaldi]|nr:ERVV2 protein [Ifrita kowaldi]